MLEIEVNGFSFCWVKLLLKRKKRHISFHSIIQHDLYSEVHILKRFSQTKPTTNVTETYKHL